MSCLGVSTSRDSYKLAGHLTFLVKVRSTPLMGFRKTDVRTTDDEDEPSSSFHADVAARFTKPSSVSW